MKAKPPLVAGFMAQRKTLIFSVERFHTSHGY